MRDIPKRIIIRLSRIALKQISLFYILHLSICCMISLFFLEKQSEIRNSFTFFEKWKVKKIILSLFLRNEKWNDFFFHSFREVKVKLKYLETEIEKWNFKIILENSRETRLSLVTAPLFLAMPGFWELLSQQPLPNGLHIGYLSFTSVSIHMLLRILDKLLMPECDSKVVFRPLLRRKILMGNETVMLCGEMTLTVFYKKLFADLEDP